MKKIQEIQDFIKNYKKWNKIHLKPTICQILESHHKFEDGINDTREYIYTTYPKLNHISKDDLELYIKEIPKYPCQQLVIGTMEDIKYYFRYNDITKLKNKPFLMSSAADWTEDLNNILISCGIDVNLNNRYCTIDYPIRVLVPKNLNRLLNNSIPRTTLLEFSIIFHKSIIKNFEINIIDTDSNIDHVIMLMKKKKRNFEATLKKVKLLSRNRVIYTSDSQNYVKYKNKMYTIEEAKAIEMLQKTL